MGDVVLDALIGDVEIPGGRIYAIAFLRHRAGQYLRLRVGDCIEHLVELRRCVQRGTQGADETGIHLFAVALEHAVEEILWNQRICHRLAAQAHPRDAPAQVFSTHRRLGVQRLMRAMESAESEMNDSSGSLRVCHANSTLGECVDVRSNVNNSTARFMPLGPTTRAELIGRTRAIRFGRGRSSPQRSRSRR